MKLLKVNVYYYFWITAIILFAISLYLFNFENSVLDINVHDTYFVIHNSHILQLLAIIYTFIAFVYWSFKKVNLELIKILTSVHTAITILVIPVYFVGHHILVLFFESDFPLFEDTKNIQILITILVLITLVAQILFILNTIICLLKYLINKTIN